MLKAILLRIAAVFGWFTAVMLLFKIIFIAVYASAIGLSSLGDAVSILWHGLPMDLSVAGYFTVIPLLLTLCRVWGAERPILLAEKAYAWLSALILGVTFAADLVLYGYWGFRLDMTPVFYFTTSPSAAMASARWWEILLGLIGVASIVTGLASGYIRYLIPIKAESFPAPSTRSRIGGTILTLALGSLLILPIRGGLTVSTMNPGRVYFSQRAGLNHAALNPLFNLLYSASHQQNFSSQYDFLSPEEAEKGIARLNGMTLDRQDLPSADSLLLIKQPDIYIVILESFSAHLLPSLGGEGVAVKLDSIAREGISFTNFYACSFRTDRALPAILAGLPALPSASVMKFTDKTEHLPGLASRLKENGYDTRYYYGGDANFTNMNSFLVSTGFDRIVSDKDFPLMERTGKWGAHDGVLLSYVSKELPRGDDRPRFTVIQTSSSHEPFEVPYKNPAFDNSPEKNAFAYTDACIGEFMDDLKRNGRYDNALVIFVADHQGAWPKGIGDPAARHHIPLIMAGGALRQKGVRIDYPASQNDIAATVISLVGGNASGFPFSKNLFDPAAPRYAFFTEPGLAATVTPQGAAIIDVATGNPTSNSADADATRALLLRLANYVDGL